MQLLLTKIKGRRFTKHNLVLAAELFCVSPAAYRMLRNSGAVCLPRGAVVPSRASDDDNLEKLLQELKPEQRLINLLFDEVKLIAALRSSGGHVMGDAYNDSKPSSWWSLLYIFAYIS